MCKHCNDDPFCEEREPIIKPPLGLQPRHIWLLKRMNMVKEAIDRYMSDNLPVPAEWIEEYNELIEKVEK